VFLRTEEKKREALRIKDQKNTPPDTPATPATPIDPLTGPNVSHESVPTHIPEAKNEAFQSATGDFHTVGDEDVQIPVADPAPAEIPVEAQQDIPQPSIEVIHILQLTSDLMLTIPRKLLLAKNQQKKAT
jgi:hypothetical protein